MKFDKGETLIKMNESGLLSEKGKDLLIQMLINPKTDFDEEIEKALEEPHKKE